MIARRRTFVNILLTTFCAAVLASPIDAQIALPQPEMFARAEYLQERELAALARPMRSSGTLEFDASGFRFRQVEPVAVTLSFDGLRLLEQTSFAGETVVAEVSDPATLAIVVALQRLLHGPVENLQDQFEINVISNDAAAWQVELRPRDATFRAIVPVIVASGAQFILQVAIDDTYGNRMRLTLSHHSQ